MEWILYGGVLAVPLLINIFAVSRLRGGYRILACLPLMVLALAYALDLVSLIGRGNLAGLFTIIAAGPSLALLAALLVARLTAAYLNRAGRAEGRDTDAPARQMSDDGVAEPREPGASA